MAVWTNIMTLGALGITSYLVAKMAKRGGSFDYHRYALIAVPVNAMPKMPRGFRTEILDAAALANHVIDAPTHVKDERLAKGLICLGAFNAKDQLTGVTWLSTEPFLEDEVYVRFEVSKNASWDTGLWIAPQFRSGRSFAALWAGTAAWLSAQNRSWSVSRIADYNLPSILSHKRMASVELGHMVVVRLGRWQFSTRARPFCINLKNRTPSHLQLDIGVDLVPLQLDVNVK